jgi:uncharacterized protein YcbX
MLVDPAGRHVTQREIPALALFEVTPIPAGLILAYGGAAIEVAAPLRDSPREPVSVWGDVLDLPEARQAREWLAQKFAQPLRLFHQPDDARRAVGEWGEPGDEVSLADAFPLLIASTASLEAVRRAGGGPDLPMERFRPNLVIEGAPPWAEDSWARIGVGAVELELAKPCARCIVTTVDQARGAFAGDEPLATLRRIRLSGDRRVPGVLFGWNAIPRRFGRLSVGDAVEVLETRAPWPIRAPAEAGVI